MPDASGNLRGISVPRVPWHEPGRCECARIKRDPKTYGTPEDASCPVHPSAPCCGDPDHRHSGPCEFWAKEDNHRG